MKKLAILLSIFVAVVACGQKKTVSVPASLVNVKSIVDSLDNAVNSMYGWEPRDSTYDNSVDTLVNAFMSVGEPGYSAGVEQEAYDNARVTWSSFKSLIDEDKYEEALALYLLEDENHTKKNAGDFMVYLKHSTQRFVFFSQVLLPLMTEYKGEAFATNEYINVLQLEKSLEDLSMMMNDQYVPETYPQLVQELGVSLAEVGRMDEAHELFNDVIGGYYGLTGDALLANYKGTAYLALLFMIDGKPDWALGVWHNFKNYLNEYASDYEPDELALCMSKIDEEMQRILSSR